MGELEIFLYLSEWRTDFWHSISMSLKNQPEKLYQVIMDSRSANLTIEPKFVKNLILNGELSIQRSHRLIDKFDFLILDQQFFDDYLVHLNKEDFQPDEVVEFLQSICKNSGETILTPAALTSVRNLLQNLHAKGSVHLIDLGKDLYKLESRIPPECKDEFFKFCLSLIPLDSHDVFSPEENIYLYILIEQYGISLGSFTNFSIHTHEIARPYYCYLFHALNVPPAIISN